MTIVSKNIQRWKYSFEKCANVGVNCRLVNDIKEMTTTSIPPLINCDVNNEVSSRITYDTDINTHHKDVNKYCNKNVIHVVSPENSVMENVNIMKKQVLMKKTLSTVPNRCVNITHNKNNFYHDCSSEMSITTEEKVILYQQEVREHVKDMVEMEKRVHDWKVNVSPKSDKNNKNMNKMYNHNIISGETSTTDPICNTRSVTPHMDNVIQSDSVTVQTGSLTYDKSVVSSMGFVSPIDDYDVYDSDTLGMTLEKKNGKQEPFPREISVLSEDFLGNICDYNNGYTNYSHYHQEINKNDKFPSQQELIDYQYRRDKMKNQNMNQSQSVNQFHNYQHITKSINMNKRINTIHNNKSQNMDMNYSQSQSRIVKRNQNCKGISENQLMIHNQNMNNEQSNNHRQLTCHNQNLNQGQIMSQDQNNNHRQLILYNRNEIQIQNIKKNGNRRGNSNMNNNISTKNSRNSLRHSKNFRNSKQSRKTNSQLDPREYNWNKELQEEYRKSSQYKQNQRNRYANHINVGGIFSSDRAFDMTSMFCGAMGVGK